MFAATSQLRRCSRPLIRGAAAVAVAGLALAGCGGSDDSAAPASAGTTLPAETSGQAKVEMKLIAFKPGDLEVAAGTTVTWEQKDAGQHTVTSGTVQQGGGGVTTSPDGRFDSGELQTDGTFEFSFDEAGSYPYFCSLHPATMRGEIRVN